MTQTASPPGHVKATRADWLCAARALLIDKGAAEVKIAAIGARLGVSRSSFYWYFRNRADLLDHLLADWARTNTGVMVAHCARPADGIDAALCNFFRCLFGPGAFDHRLDFAVREWARRDEAVLALVRRGDAARQAAIARMYERFGFDAAEAETRARVLYYHQIGYYALAIDEPLEARLARAEGYLTCFIGAPPDPAVLAAFIADARALAEPQAGEAG